MSESPPTAPVCYRHTSRETWVRCTRCERPICPDCMREASVGHQCPECVAEGRRTQRSARTAFGGGVAGREGYVTKALIGLNILVALIGVALSGAQALIGNGLFTSAGQLQAIGGVVGPSVQISEFGPVYPGIDNGGVYRLVTAMFIHYGLLHLLLNMWAIWVLGRNLEAVLGPVRFLALYLLAGLGGNVAAYLLSPGSLSAGASTAVFGLFAAYFIVLRRLRMDTSSVVGVLVVNLVLTFAVPRISWEGHVGGLIAGGLVGLVLAYAPRPHRTLIQAAGCGALLLVLLALTVLRMLTH
ncbi:Membrane associated serine protease, rhomboid family [Micromonospora pattaloongensis]|uniref:Membrane associated serine protease, rhomboid family n=1 Tax=Micromonospora pattaloongensis TaxID=405436 RepID=A0A1H3HLT9_9ACTN|nr:rhomboid family intramembrane serine protease [Micromonospora pattaloongensis]SDY16461.1 Membrane associated serine protease, rhomboid family [Micromonospora pattaloongensis]